MTTRFDAIVIGGGSGGLAFARAAAEFGAKVCLIEQAELGGTCVNRGCVPKKLLWEAAWIHERAVAQADQAGLAHPAPPAFPTLQEAIARKIAGIRDSFGESLDRPGLTLRRGEAALTGPREVTVEGDVLTADRIVLATGANPDRPDLPGIDLAGTSNDVFQWDSLPDRLAILGGGYIGCEFASIFRGFDVAVTLIEPEDRVLAGFDADLARAARDILAERGVDIRLGVTPEAIAREGDALRIDCDSGATVRCDRVVAATGRTPRTDLAGGVTDEIERAESGAFAVDAGLETSMRGIYALGDCADRLPLTPVATRDGDRLARRLFGPDTPALIDLDLVASAAFVMPPVAQVGAPGDAEAAEGADLGVGAIMPEGHWSTRTLRKLAEADGRLRGAAGMGASAADTIGALGAAIAGDPDAATGIHPSFAEELVGRD